MSYLEELKKEIKDNSNSEKASLLMKFFKTGKGEYGEGDLFLGLIVPIQRKISKKYEDKIGLEEIQELLNSKIHEFRLIALFILIKKYEKANKIEDEYKKREISDFYIKNVRKGNVNNWDLVDLSAPNILGNYLIEKDRKILYNLVKSSSLWERRVAVLSCFSFIRERDFKDALKIAEILIQDKQDLIHKAVGWMLREIGKREEKVLRKFLDKYSSIMPRTMLRYSIEKFSREDKDNYMGKI